MRRIKKIGQGTSLLYEKARIKKIGQGTSLMYEKARIKKIGQGTSQYEKARIRKLDKAPVCMRRPELKNWTRHQSSV